MLKDKIETDVESEGEFHDLTLIVKRTKLRFNDKECIVLNFQDITTYKKLKYEEDKGKLLSTLCSSVHHEMISPLKSIVSITVHLIRKLQDRVQRELAQLIFITSRQILLHANDLLD